MRQSRFHLLTYLGAGSFVLVRKWPPTEPVTSCIDDGRIAVAVLTSIAIHSRVKIQLDSGRSVEFNLRTHPHLDYGYAVTSHSSQGQTADRVLIHVDSEQAHPNLINSRMAYVSVSRARYDAHIYTNDKTNLAQQLSRDVSHRSAVEPDGPSAPLHKIDRASLRSHAGGIPAAHGVGR